MVGIYKRCVLFWKHSRRNYCVPNVFYGKRKAFASYVRGLNWLCCFNRFYGLVTNPYLALALLVMMGPAYQLRDAAQETIYQNACRSGVLSKVIAAKSTLVQGAFILSIAFVGTVADFFGVRIVYLFASFLLLVTSLIGIAVLVHNKQSVETTSPVERGENI